MMITQKGDADKINLIEEDETKNRHNEVIKHNKTINNNLKP